MLKPFPKRAWADLPPLFFVFATIWVAAAETVSAAVFTGADPVRLLLLLRGVEIIGLIGLIWRLRLAGGIGLSPPDKASIRVFVSMATLSGL
ncbi:MAG: hypothetical protein R8L58_04265, partial [Mariprofundaceae bacterium]